MQPQNQSIERHKGGPAEVAEVAAGTIPVVMRGMDNAFAGLLRQFPNLAQLPAAVAATETVVQPIEITPAPVSQPTVTSEFPASSGLLQPETQADLDEIRRNIDAIHGDEEYRDAA